MNPREARPRDRARERSSFEYFMDINQLLDYVLKPQPHLSYLVQSMGVWFYLLLFAIIFCETGLVVTPFLPGDSLLFAVGALASGSSSLNMALLFALLTVAA